MDRSAFKGILILLIFGTGFILSGCYKKHSNRITRYENRRGIVVYPSDIRSVGVDRWISIMMSADLNLLGIHGFNDTESLSKLESFIRSRDGILLLQECKRNNIDVEFETHALHLLLPRELFNEHPEYFRMDANGVRQNDLNMCFSSDSAYLEIEKNIRSITRWLKPTTNRYFFWADDALNGYCHCDLCSKYTESEQALMYENRLLGILRKVNPSATLAHLAYNNTYGAPLKIKPDEGIFLEYAPIDRNLASPISESHIRNLKDNLKIFPKNTAHILEYWVDVSKFSQWKRDSLVKIPWNKQNCERDVAVYNDLGIKSMTSFGVWINNDYLNNYGEDSTRLLLKEYGLILKKYQP
jgi:hypothetical protein